jgi:hypothetical protein
MKRITLSLLAATFAIAASAHAPAYAQDATCQAIGGMLEERAKIVEQINALGSDNVDPRRACRLFRSLDENGTKVGEFLDENQAWCQIPADFVAGFKEDQTRVASVRGEACNAAAQINRLERQAREQQNQGGAFGGPGLTGQFPIPRGAL